MTRSCAAAEAARLADPPELSVAMAHAESCPACRSWWTEVDSLGSTMRAAARGPDDITRAHIQARLSSAIESLNNSATRAWRGRMVAGAIGAAAAALVALMVLPRDSNKTAAPVAVTATRPTLIPHLAAGPAAMKQNIRKALGTATRALEVDHSGGLLRAVLTPVGRLTLVGPGRVSVEQDAAGEVRLRLDRGLLLLSVDPRRRTRVSVRVGDLTVTVKGTVFAVDAQKPRTRVSVSEGVVAVQEGSGPSRLLRQRQSWSVGTNDRALIDDNTARLLDEHERVPTYSADHSGLLILDGSPSGTARLGTVALGPTPIAARLPRKPAQLTLEAAGHATSSVTVEIRDDRPTRVGYRLSPSAAPSPANSSAPEGAVAKASAAAQTMSAKTRYARAEAAMAAGNNRLARQNLAALLQDHPRSPLSATALLDLARLSRELGETGAQCRYLRRLLRRRNVDHALRDSAHLQRCRCELSLRRRAVARRCLVEHRAAFSGSPGSSEALALLAVLTLADGCEAVSPLLAEHARRFPETPLIKKLRRRCPGK